MKNEIDGIHNINMKAHLHLEWKIQEKKENSDNNNIHHHFMYPCTLLKFSYINQIKIMRKKVKLY